MALWRPRVFRRAPASPSSDPAYHRLTDTELAATQAADLAADRAEDERMWTRWGEVRVACVGCDSEIFVPLLCAASPAYCRTTSWDCFPPEM